MSGGDDMNKNMLVALMDNQDKAAAYDVAVKIITRFFQDKVTSEKIYEIEQDDIIDMAKDLAGELFLPETEEVDGYIMC